jgi:hypothetical protein
MTARLRLIAPMQTVTRAPPLLLLEGTAVSVEEPNEPAPISVLIPERLFMPVSVTIKRSLWVLHTTKQQLFKD